MGRAGSILVGRPHEGPANSRKAGLRRSVGHIDPSEIPEVPNDRVVYVDGYGNLKTTTKHGALAMSSGMVLGVRIGDVEREATASDRRTPFGRFLLPDGLGAGAFAARTLYLDALGRPFRRPARYPHLQDAVLEPGAYIPLLDIVR